MADVTHANSPALVGTTVNVTANHEGVNAVPFNFVAGGVTVSTSTVIFLAKIPHGAIITSLNMSAWAPALTQMSLDVGLVGESSLDYLVDGTNISSTGGTAALTVRTGALPHFVSLSDDTQPRFRYLQCKVVSSTSAEVSMIVRGTVEYVMGRPTIGN